MRIGPQATSVRLKRLAALLALGVLPTIALGETHTAKRWEFNRNGDREGWTVPADVRGAVLGGSVLLTLNPKEADPSKISKMAYQWLGDNDPDPNLLVSPADLDLPAADVTQVRMRVLNLSSLTDFLLRWRTKEGGWGPELELFVIEPGQQWRRCTLKADLKEWQEITCYLDQRWRGTLEQIAISKSLQSTLRGDLWIDSVEIGRGAPEPVQLRPDVKSAQVVPRVTIPGISQAGFQRAFDTLDRCLAIDVPLFGFNYPVMSPGGYYIPQGWFQLDSTVALTGAQWANQRFAEDVVRGFTEVQATNPDGRIDWLGFFWIRGQPADLSSLPKFFEAAYEVARRTKDAALRAQIYQSMRKYLEWWLSPVKRDGRTGLISGMGEETFGDRLQAPPNQGSVFAMEPMTLAPVDLNVLVAIGAHHTATLATALGKAEDARRYRDVFEELARAINTYLWNDASGAYYNYDLPAAQHRAALNVTIFDPLRLQIAPVERRHRLLKRLLDPAQFNWGRRPLTSWAKTESAYVEAKGNYDGRAWFGNIWTLRNMNVVQGLEESERPDLAAELNWATIKQFHDQYFEYLLPSSGQGQGAENYAWTASQYIGAIVEHLFGVDFDHLNSRLGISPHVPKALYGRTLKLERLLLPTGEDTRLSLVIRQTSPSAARIDVRIDGPLPPGELDVGIPGASRRKQGPMGSTFSASFE